VPVPLDRSGARRRRRMGADGRRVDRCATRGDSCTCFFEARERGKNEGKPGWTTSLPGRRSATSLRGQCRPKPTPLSWGAGNAPNPAQKDIPEKVENLRSCEKTHRTPERQCVTLRQSRRNKNCLLRIAAYSPHSTAGHAWLREAKMTTLRAILVLGLLSAFASSVAIVDLAPEAYAQQCPNGQCP